MFIFTRNPPSLLLNAKRWWLFAAISFLPCVANASCSFAAAPNTTGTLAITVPTTVTVPRDAVDGTVIYTSAMVAPPFQVSVNCTGDPVGVVNSVGTQPASGIKEYPIGNTGLSFRWVYFNGVTGTTGNVNPISGPITQNDTRGFGGSRHGFQLVKTGSIAANATVPGGQVASWNFGTLVALRMNLSNPIQVVGQTCLTPNVSVPLETHKISEFGAIGSDSQNPKGFNIAIINCPAGIKTISISLMPTTVQLAPGVMALDTTSTASGIGIKIMNRDGNTMSFNTLYRINEYGGNGGSFDFPMKAAYTKTADKIVGGKANGSLTFTMTYQ